MQKFLDAIVSRISVPYKRLSIIRNPDGFLADRTVQQAIGKEFGICFVTGSSIELRCHFELTYKLDRNVQYCYLCDNPAELLPDIRGEAFCETFNVADLFPNFMDKQVLKGLKVDVLEHLFLTNTNGYVSSSDAKMRILEYQLREKAQPEVRPEDFRKRLDAVVWNWSKMDEVAESVAGIVADAIKAGYYSEIEPSINVINKVFQEGLISQYSEAVTSNPLLKARAVNKVLPHLASTYSAEEKVALVVVDGMSYWQYAVLREHLSAAGIKAEDRAMFSWLPSITMLSRQAIFRGDAPRQDYKQNPGNESKLWSGFWEACGVKSADIQYIYDGDGLDIFDTTKRLALVTVELDEKMHASTDNADLMALTENWAKRFVEKIKRIKEAGFVLYLTTDHGNLLSRGWRNLTSGEKTFLYKDGSRGTRHLIYENLDEMNAFRASNPDAEMVQHQNWLAFSGNQCFQKAGAEMITHGGTHFLETVIPFVKI